MAPPTDPDWSDRARAALAKYAEVLLRRVASRLVKPRTQQPADDLIEKSVAVLTNPPVVDRRIKELPPASRKLLALVGLSRQPRWKVGHLLSLLASLGHSEGFEPIAAALEAGLLFPELSERTVAVDDFTTWWGAAGTNTAVVFVHSAVAARARGEDLGLPDLYSGDRSVATHVADGLDWPLRLAAVWQQVEASPVRLTQGNTLFKRDLTRLQADAVLAAPLAEHLVDLPDPGVLALLWSKAAGLLAETDGDLRANMIPASWDAGLNPVLAGLAAVLPHVEAWDPLLGYAPSDTGLSSLPSAGLLALLLVRDWTDPGSVAAWLWEHHPSWSGGLAHERSRDWVEAFLFGVALPLRLVEANAERHVRLSDFGRHHFAGGPEPTLPPAFPQTLLVQPNAEVLAYRQGLTPELIGTLSRFARWTGIGPACTLELNPEQTYRGLESGLTLPMLLQTLARHSTRPVPANVADLLQRWANKRDRITVFASAVLVEFPTAADLDAAINRGIVSIRLTDRIGISADGKEPALNQLRLLANRDYDGKPQRCLKVGDDGVTLTVDAAQADLLLEAEIGRYAEPLPLEGTTARQFRLSPQSLRRAGDLGLSLGDIDLWFYERSGQPLSPAGRLFLLGSQLPPPTAARTVIVRFPTPEMADGAMQWPATRRLVAERIGPTAVVVADEELDDFRAALAEVGANLNGDLFEPRP